MLEDVNNDIGRDWFALKKCWSQNRHDFLI